jgi:hypothetical protein
MARLGFGIPWYSLKGIRDYAAHQTLVPRSRLSRGRNIKRCGQRLTSPRNRFVILRCLVCVINRSSGLPVADHEKKPGTWPGFRY